MLRDRTEFFFAPAHIQKRIGDWGHDGYAEKTNSFMTARAIQSKNWMQVKEIHGLEKFTGTYEEMVSGNINPNEGIIVNLNQSQGEINEKCIKNSGWSYWYVVFFKRTPVDH
jgi:hypothetical protein